jgi:hypothetical protein
MNTAPPGEPVWVPDNTVTHQEGSIEDVGTEPERAVAVLWLPDPEQRHGWREYYVKKAASKPCARRMGYRRG